VLASNHKAGNSSVARSLTEKRLQFGGVQACCSTLGIDRSLGALSHQGDVSGHDPTPDGIVEGTRMMR
jgi:hypothetical protein